MDILAITLYESMRELRCANQCDTEMSNAISPRGMTMAHLHYLIEFFLHINAKNIEINFHLSFR